MPPPLYPNPSFWLELAFQGLVAVLFTAMAMGMRYALGPRIARRFSWGLIALLFIDGGLALTGKLAFGPLPPPIFAVVLLGSGAALWLALSRVGGGLVRGLGYTWLIGFQVFRFPLELLMHRAYSEGVMPVQMSYSGYNFDILTGVSAFLVALFYHRGQLPRWGLWAWNLMGSALLLTIVFIAIVSMPTSFRLFHEGPANVWIIYWPFVWLPGFFVPAALLGHVLVFRKLVTEGASDPD